MRLTVTSALLALSLTSFAVAYPTTAINSEPDTHASELTEQPQQEHDLGNLHWSTLSRREPGDNKAGGSSTSREDKRKPSGGAGKAGQKSAPPKQPVVPTPGRSSNGLPSQPVPANPSRRPDPQRGSQSGGRGQAQQSLPIVHQRPPSDAIPFYTNPTAGQVRTPAYFPQALGNARPGPSNTNSVARGGTPAQAGRGSAPNGRGRGSGPPRFNGYVNLSG
ncbi:hypothetical protein K474DRAFT_1661916 [Panus rudis PR-1116 ss-1]|nr:hypothetical protein K474DRAFT_1661916 [Panus rudis PR-1116 ss-1]